MRCLFRLHFIPNQTTAPSLLQPLLLRGVFGALAGVESQTVGISRESDNTALGKVEDVARLSVDLLAGLVRDGELSFQNDLHLVVGVGVDKWGAFLKAVETARDGLLSIRAAK